MVQRTRPRITITVDPAMLEEVDAYVEQHEGTDRSKVVDEALRAWHAQIIHEALVKQHATPKSSEEIAERAAWKRIRAAQLARHRRPASESGEA
jgi:metal-responsive CopG/Arc/MetJ family transcriptional regulator